MRVGLAETPAMKNSEWTMPVIIIAVVMAVAVFLAWLMPHFGFNTPHGYP
jgi:hypothetical protein